MFISSHLVLLQRAEGARGGGRGGVRYSRGKDGHERILYVRDYMFRMYVTTWTDKSKNELATIARKTDVGRKYIK